MDLKSEILYKFEYCTKNHVHLIAYFTHSTSIYYTNAYNVVPKFE